MDQIRSLVEILTPVILLAYIIVGLKIKVDIDKNQKEINRNINALHTRLADDKAELVKNQTAIKEELTEKQSAIAKTIDIHIAEDRIIFAQILEKLNEIHKRTF